jgi:CRP/FNR family transcriptional regulator
VTKRVTLIQAWEGNTDCLNCTIRSSALFSGLTEKDFESFHEPVEQVEMKPGEVLYKVGDVGHHLYTVRSGLVKLLQYLPDGTQRIVRIASSMDVLGLELLVAPYFEHEAVVLQTTQLCRYPKEAVNRISQTNPQLHRSLMVKWKKVLTDADAWLTQLSTGPAKKRMANLLLRLVENEDNSECHLFSREDIGSILSITIETASRTISEFKRLKLIKEIRPNHFYLDIAGLEEIASA